MLVYQKGLLNVRTIRVHESCYSAITGRTSTPRYVWECPIIGISSLQVPKYDASTKRVTIIMITALQYTEKDMDHGPIGEFS